MTDIQPKFQAVKAVHRDLRAIWEKLQLHTLATPPIKKPTAGAAADSAVEQYEREQQQYRQWMKLLEYERENPLHLDDSALRSRVRHVFKHALCYIRFYPEAWHAFAQYEEVSYRSARTRFGWAVVKANVLFCFGVYLSLIAEKCRPS